MQSHPKTRARRPTGRRAFSLFELLAVLVLIGLVSGMAITRFGSAAFQTTSAEGLTRRLTLDISQARRRAIATGEDHYVQFTRSGGEVVSYAVHRSAGGGAYQADETVAIPDGATVTTSSDTWTFDFDGALTTSGDSSVIRVNGDRFYWDITVYHATGATTVDKVEQP